MRAIYQYMSNMGMIKQCTDLIDHSDWLNNDQLPVTSTDCRANGVMNNLINEWLQMNGWMGIDVQREMDHYAVKDNGHTSREKISRWSRMNRLVRADCWMEGKTIRWSLTRAGGLSDGKWMEMDEWMDAVAGQRGKRLCHHWRRPDRWCNRLSSRSMYAGRLGRFIV